MLQSGYMLARTEQSWNGGSALSFSNRWDVMFLLSGGPLKGSPDFRRM